MRKLIVLSSFFLGIVSLFADTLTPRLNLTLPTLDQDDIWGAKLNNNFSTIDSSITIATYQGTNIKDYPYLAKGDGNTDDTLAIQNAINAAGPNSRVFFPAGTYRLTAPININNSSVTFAGVGLASKIVQTGILTNATIFFVYGQADTFTNLYMVPNSSTAHTLDGLAIALEHSNYSKIDHCYVSGHRRGAFTIDGSSHTIISNNFIFGSVLTSTDTSPVGAGQDIGFGSGGGDYNLIEGNIIDHGAGTGINVGSDGIGLDEARNNIISNNIVSNECVYGITNYSANISSTIPPNLTGTIISNNVVQHITGDCRDSATNSYFYGTGIYVQGGERTIVSGNYVEDTSSSTNIFELAPGGIGCTNVQDVTITGNIVKNTHAWPGISILDPSFIGDTTGYATITGNAIRETTIGIYALGRGRANISGNALDRVTQGIQVDNAQYGGINGLLYPDVSIKSNSIRNSSGSGIIVSSTIYLSVQDNQAVGYAAYGMDLIGSSTTLISGNNFTNSVNGAACILIDTPSVNTMVWNNSCGISSGTINAFGMIIYSTTSLKGNRVTGTGQDWVGVYGLTRTLAANATPSVKDGNYFITANSAGPITYTNFTGGDDGQEIVIEVKDSSTTFSCTGNLHCNSGSSFHSPISGLTRCTFNETDPAWYCNVQ